MAKRGIRTVMPDLYGTGAFPINYPNEFDRREGRGARAGRLEDRVRSRRPDGRLDLRRVRRVRAGVPHRRLAAETGSAGMIKPQDFHAHDAGELVGQAADPAGHGRHVGRVVERGQRKLDADRQRSGAAGRPGRGGVPARRWNSKQSGSRAIGS